MFLLVHLYGTQKEQRSRSGRRFNSVHVDLLVQLFAVAADLVPLGIENLLPQPVACSEN